MNNTLYVPEETTFECPEGIYLSKLAEVRWTETLAKDRTGIKPLIRWLYQLDIPRVRNRIVMAGKNFPPSVEPHSPLRVFLDTWLGPEFIEMRLGGKLTL